MCACGGSDVPSQRVSVQVMCLSAILVEKLEYVQKNDSYAQSRSSVIIFMNTQMFSYIFNGVLVCVTYSLCFMFVSVMVLFITRVVGGEDRLAEGPNSV